MNGDVAHPPCQLPGRHTIGRRPERFPRRDRDRFRDELLPLCRGGALEPGASRRVGWNFSGGKSPFVGEPLDTATLRVALVSDPRIWSRKRLGGTVRSEERPGASLDEQQKSQSPGGALPTVRGTHGHTSTSV